MGAGRSSRGQIVAAIVLSSVMLLLLQYVALGSKGGVRGGAQALQRELDEVYEELDTVKKDLKKAQKTLKKQSKAGKQVDNERERKETPPEKSKQDYTVQINVFTYNRLKGLKRLWKSLVESDYLGHEVPLTIFFDKKEAPRDDTENWIRKISWPHGPLRIHRREQNVGLKKSIMEAWYPTGDDDTYGVFFEDDIEASPLWYLWVDSALKEYGKDKNSKLLGVSLYRPIHDELTAKSMKQLNTNGDPFLLQQPCSWGAVYFPRPWRKFRDWYIEKGHETDPVTKGHGLPYISSNTWSAKSSWKKYLIKYMYEKGLFMVYPNTPDKTVLTTNHLMKGEHPTPKRELFELPLLTKDVYEEHMQSGTNILRAPRLDSLKAYDIAVRDVGTFEGMPNYDAEF
eukprot:TRINITY_DN11818_c0_g2_i1.p1 TRINITY_DN11818_c0_g2~~TRINITY_DN11818_c0_g2_i1.p1  ORF type:complete len:398 (+),score=94.96 TRINITY_DN11818_c0_g2_i1:297-1490(+)